MWLWGSPSLPQHPLRTHLLQAGGGTPRSGVSGLEALEPGGLDACPPGHSGPPVSRLLTWCKWSPRNVRGVWGGSSWEGEKEWPDSINNPQPWRVAPTMMFLLVNSICPGLIPQASAHPAPLPPISFLPFYLLPVPGAASHLPLPPPPLKHPSSSFLGLMN